MNRHLTFACMLAALAVLALPGWAQDAQRSAACLKCHDSESMPDMSKSAHAFATDKRTPDCVSCHGPSPTHVRKPAGVSERPLPDVTFGKTAANRMSASARSQVCLSCHDRDAARMMWSLGQHVSADVACDSCHKVHSNHDRMLDKLAQADGCYSCHQTQRSQMMRLSHHPVPEGKMTCSDCHNVHGSTGPKLVSSESINLSCYACHVEKRGPLVHQHQPVAEDCVNCHNPHGSNVPGMLTARAPMLCKQCHTPHVEGALGLLGGQTGGALSAAAAGRNALTMWQGRSCMNCHTQVHGSNNPAGRYLMH